MRDLTSRLRDIVRKDHGGSSPVAARRELTYVPDTGGLARGHREPAEALGGTPLGDDTGRVHRDRSRLGAASQSHGRRAVGSFVLAPDAPLALFDSAGRAQSAWADRVVFFDLETTGLSGGAGTLPFLAGCGWFEDGAFRVRQFFLVGRQGSGRCSARSPNPRGGQPARDVQWPHVRRAADGNALGLPSHVCGHRRRAALRHAAAGAPAVGPARSAAEMTESVELQLVVARTVGAGIPSHRRRARLRDPRALLPFPSHGRCLDDRQACSSTIATTCCRWPP